MRRLLFSLIIQINKPTTQLPAQLSWYGPRILRIQQSQKLRGNWVMIAAAKTVKLDGEIMPGYFLPVPDCVRWDAGWTGGGPAELGSCSLGRPPEQRCPAGSPPRSDTGSRAEAGWSPNHFRQVPCQIRSRNGDGLLASHTLAKKEEGGMSRIVSCG